MHHLAIGYEINVKEMTDYIVKLEFGDQTQNVDATKTLRNFNFVIACNIWLFIHDDDDEDNQWNMIIPLKSDEKDIASTHLTKSNHNYKATKYKIAKNYQTAKHAVTNNRIVTSISRIPKALTIGVATCIKQTTDSIACICVGGVMIIVSNIAITHCQIKGNIQHPSVKGAAGSALIVPLWACASLVGGTLGGAMAVAAVPIQTVGATGLYIYNGTNTNDTMDWYSISSIIPSFRETINNIYEFYDAVVVEESISSFKTEHSFEKRKKESQRVRKKYPHKIPVIVEGVERLIPRNLSNHIPIKKKYLPPYDLTVGQMSYVIRKRFQLLPEQSLFPFVNNTLPSTAATMSELYWEHRDEDGFLYITYVEENCYGFGAK